MKIDSKMVDKLNETMPWLKYSGNILHKVETPYGHTLDILEYEDLSEAYANDPEYLEWQSRQQERRQKLKQTLEKNYVDKYWVDYTLGGEGLVFYMGSKGQNNISQEQREHLQERFREPPISGLCFRKLLAELTLLGVIDSNVALCESQAMHKYRKEHPDAEFSLQDYIEHIVKQIKADRCEWGAVRKGDDMVLEHSLRIRIAGYEKLNEVLHDLLL